LWDFDGSLAIWHGTSDYSNELLNVTAVT